MSYYNVLYFDDSPLLTYVVCEFHVITPCDPPIIESCDVDHCFHQSSSIPIYECRVLCLLSMAFLYHVCLHHLLVRLLIRCPVCLTLMSLLCLAF